MAMNASIVLKLLDGVTGPIRKVQQEIANASHEMKEFSERAESAFKKGKNITQGAAELKEFNEKIHELSENLTKPFEELEHSLARVNAVTGATKEEMESVENAARKVGATGRASASEAAGAMEQMAQNGFTVGDAVATLNTQLDRARVENVSLSQAVEESTTTAKKFGLALSDEVIKHLNDLQAKTAVTAGTSMQKLNLAMSESGVAAHSAGVSLERTAYFVGLLAQKGLQGGEAGEALNMMFRNMNHSNVQKTIEQASGGMVKLRDSTGKVRDPLAILTDLTTDMTKKGVDLGHQTTFLNQLFPRNAKAIQALIEASKAPGAEKLNNALEDVNGTAKEMADKTLENGIDKTRLLQGAFENLEMTIGKTMTPRMDVLKEKLAGAIINVTEWLEKNPKLATTIGYVVSGVAALTSGLVALTSVASAFFALKGIALLAGGWAQFGGVMLTIGVPIAAAAAAMVGLSAAVFELHKNWELLTSGDAWKNYFKGVGESVMDNGVLSTLGQMVDPRTLMNDVGNALTPNAAQAGAAQGNVNVNVRGPATAAVGKGSSGVSVSHDPRAGVPMLGGG